MEILRTPESRFDNLPGFPYTPRYLHYGDIRMAYIDEESTLPGVGTSEKTEVFLCLHGEPTWSYLYRKMIPIFLNYNPANKAVKRRVVAPDLIGFGRSDKPADESVYTFDNHWNSLARFIEVLDLQNITLVCQDWGGLLGLTLPVVFPNRFSRFIIMNTTLAIGIAPSKGFDDWKAFVNNNADLAVGKVIWRGTKHLTPAEVQAYDAPFPDATYKAGVRRFPNLVMVEQGMQGVAISKHSVAHFRTHSYPTNSVFLACGMADPVLGPPVMRGLAKQFNNGCFYTEIPEAGHFVQEWGDKVARTALEIFAGQTEKEGVTIVMPGKGGEKGKL